MLLNTPEEVLKSIGPKLKEVADVCYRWNFIVKEYKKEFLSVAV